MYPPIACTVCGRNIFAEYEIMIEYNKKHSKTIEELHRFYLSERIEGFDLSQCFDALELQPCCRVDLMTTINKIPEIYGYDSMDKK